MLWLKKNSSLKDRAAWLVLNVGPYPIRLSGLLSNGSANEELEEVARRVVKKKMSDYWAKLTAELTNIQKVALGDAATKHLKQIILGDNGYLLACAQHHNRKMHVSNGNIEFLANETESCLDSLIRVRNKAWYHPVVEQEECSDPVILMQKGIDLQQRKSFCNQHGEGGSYLAAMGTLHTQLKINPRTILSMGKEDLAKLAKDLGWVCDCGTKIKEGKEPSEPVAGASTGAIPKKIHKGSIGKKKDKSTDAQVEDITKCELCVADIFDQMQDEFGLNEIGIIEDSGETLAFQAALAQKEVVEALRWVRVGYGYPNRGKLVATDIVTDYIEKLKMPNFLSILLNGIRDEEDEDESEDERAWRRPFVIPASVGIDLSGLELARADWRDLGLRIALYDDLREARFTQPTGVEWAIAMNSNWRRTTVFSTTWGDKWGYRAVFMSASRLEKFLKGRTTNIVVQIGGVTEDWDLKCPSTLMIFIGDDANWMHCGIETWVLSHLSYPLAGIGEVFNIIEGHRDGIFTEMFLRTSGLVDIPKLARNIIFVSTNIILAYNGDKRIRLGGYEFDVTRKGDELPPIHEFDNALRGILQKCLNSSTSLKLDFSYYVKDCFTGECDWMEVEQLTSYLTTRWVAQPEVRKDGDRLLANWIPQHVKKMYKKDLDDGEIYEGGSLGHDSAVLSFDHPVAPLYEASRFPVLHIGTWNHEVELILGLGLGKYETSCIEKEDAMRKRLRAGGWDRLQRACYMRLGFEEWKRQLGIRDEIACPGAYGGCLPAFWSRLLYMDPAGSNVTWAAKTLCTHEVQWSWAVSEAHIVRETFTGLRSTSDWFKSGMNIDWRKVKITNITEERYQIVKQNHGWAFQQYLATAAPQRETNLERTLMRADLLQWHKSVEYKGWPNYTQVTDYAFRIESRETNNLYVRGNWCLGALSQISPTGLGYGWGARPRLRLWDQGGGYLTIVLDNALVHVLEGSHYAVGTWLACGDPWANLIDETSLSDELRMMGFK